MTFYVTSANFDVLSVIINILLSKKPSRKHFEKNNIHVWYNIRHVADILQLCHYTLLRHFYLSIHEDIYPPLYRDRTWPWFKPPKSYITIECRSKCQHQPLGKYRWAVIEFCMGSRWIAKVGDYFVDRWTKNDEKLDCLKAQCRESSDWSTIQWTTVGAYWKVGSEVQNELSRNIWVSKYMVTVSPS